MPLRSAPCSVSGTPLRGNGAMGIIINFPEARRELRDAAGGGETATIMILPVVRIERPNDQPPSEASGNPAGRKRRRRARRS